VPWALLFSGALAYAALYAPQPLLPAIERALGAPPGAAGWGMAAPMLGLVLGPWGLLPRLAPRPALLLGLLGVGGGSLFAGLLPGFWVWVLLRFLVGVALSAVAVLGFALLPRLFPGRRAVAAFVALNALGGTLGRSAAGGLAALLGVPGALVLLGGLPLVLVPFFLRGRLPPPPRPQRPRPARAMGVGGVLLFANLFLANLLPYRLEAAGVGLAGVGAFYLAYLGGLVGPFLAGRLGEGAALLLALVGGTMLLTPAAGPGFFLFLSGVFGLHARFGEGFGRRGESAAYISGYYLGGMLAGLAYPPFLGRPLIWAVGLSLALILLGFRYNPAK